MSRAQRSQPDQPLAPWLCVGVPVGLPVVGRRVYVLEDDTRPLAERAAMRQLVRIARMAKSETKRGASKERNAANRHRNLQIRDAHDKLLLELISKTPCATTDRLSKILGVTSTAVQDRVARLLVEKRVTRTRYREPGARNYGYAYKVVV